MGKLTANQLKKIHAHLLGTGPSDVLQHELLDHLACQVEEQMGKGLPFEAAWKEVLAEASSQAVRNLKATYGRELTLKGEKLRQASLNDIVFEYRNKAYGAYPLRQAYPATVFNALLASTGLFLLLLAGLNLIY